jgi:hypothetical protein
MLATVLIFLAAFGTALTLERMAHRRLQEACILLTGNVELATALYAVVLLPGVALHEVSHALMAALLGVRVRRLSLRPERHRGGAIRLGYVEVLRSDALRSSLIGAAPLFAGLAALSAIGMLVFDLEAMQLAVSEVSLAALVDALLALPRATDSWLWIYLAFAIANSMMPSASDVQAWPTLLAGLTALAVVALALVGAPAWAAIAPLVLSMLRWLTAIFLLTACINLLAVVALRLAAVLVEALTGRHVEFR